MNINKQLERLNVSSKYGAPMGRHHIMNNDDTMVYLQRVEFVDGAYDRGGAYWGSGTPLWCAMDNDGDVMLFTRANTLAQAKADILNEYPDLTFVESEDIDIDEFTRHYALAALWSSCDEDSDPLDDNYTTDDIHPDSYAAMRKDCEEFVEANKDDLLTWDGNYSVEEKGGHDFWLTRNGHGAGFWDGDWQKDVGKRLTKNAKTYGEVFIFVNDDGKVRVE